MTKMCWCAAAGALLAFAGPACQAAMAPLPAPKPAFVGQTGAPAPKTASAYEVRAIANKLEGPWSLAFLPNGKMLVTERNGSMRIVTREGIHWQVAGVPPVKVASAQSLHDVVLDPNFAQNRMIYFSYFAPPPGESAAVWPNEYFYDRVFSKSVAERRAMRVGTERVARARLSDDETRLEKVEVILEGGERRLAFAKDGTLYVTGADRFRFYDGDLSGGDKQNANLSVRKNFSGRVSRINTDGTIPKDNPFLADPLVPPDTFSFGHRDPEGGAINPTTGELWTVEHGPRGGDELNIIRPGKDYGWPVISYGWRYDGKPVGSGQAARAGMEQPIYYWYPSIAPSGMLFYSGDLFPAWKGNLFVGALGGQHLIRLILDGDKVVGEERLLEDQKQRIRDVRQGPDGAIYLLTDTGSLLRVGPKS